MSLFGLNIFGLGKGKISPDSAPMNPRWVRTAEGKYHRLVFLDPEAEGLDGKSGVFVIWHAGVRPAWVYVGRAANLARELHAVAKNDDVMDYEVNGGLFVTWAPIREEHQLGAVAYLTEKLHPLAGNPDVKKADHVPVLSPADVIRKR